MTEGGGFIQRRAINVIIVKPEIKADRICGEICTALNYINTGFCSLPSEELKLRYTQEFTGNQENTVLATASLPFSSCPAGISLFWKRYQTGTLYSWWSTGRWYFAATSMTWILVSTEFYSSQSLTESTHILK